MLRKFIGSLNLIISGKVNPGNKITNDTNIIGEIISCFNNLAIAMLKIEDANNAFKKERILKTDSANLKIIR